MKHTSTPEPTKVWINALAPITSHLPVRMRGHVDAPLLPRRAPAATAACRLLLPTGDQPTPDGHPEDAVGDLTTQLPPHSLGEPHTQHDYPAAARTHLSRDSSRTGPHPQKSADITHPLNVLEDAALIAKEADVFRRGRWFYRVTEPLITFYEVVMRPEWYRLESGQAEAAWRDQQADFFSRVAGPHDT